MPRSRCLRISEKHSLGKRASASTAAAVVFATSAAARARAVRSFWRTLTTRVAPGIRSGSIDNHKITLRVYASLKGIMRRVARADNQFTCARLRDGGLERA